MEEFEVGESVRINTPGESHHKRTGVVAQRYVTGRYKVDLGDVQWTYWPDELMKDREWKERR
jgi:hypothetical protein